MYQRVIREIKGLSRTGGLPSFLHLILKNVDLIVIKL